MPTNAVAENVFGTIGTILWTVQLIPQIFKSWSTKSTEGLSAWLMLMWYIASLPFGIYAIIQDLNVPLIVQPQLFALLSLLSWSQCMYYAHARSRSWCLGVLVAALVSFAAFEAGIVFALRPSYRRGTAAAEAGVRFFGILSSALNALALLPQYYEIYRLGAVVGISLTLMSLDLLGCVFSILSLVFRSRFDPMAALGFSLFLVMDGLMLVLAVILNPHAKRRARGAGRVDIPRACDDSVTKTVLPVEKQDKETDLVSRTVQ